MAQLKRDGAWHNRDFPPPSALLTAWGILKETFDGDLSWHDIRERMKFYRARNNMFKRITNAPETYWERDRNYVVADDNFWTRPIEEANFARVYYHNGEPEWMNLSNMFGLGDVKTEDGQTVIVISDSTTRNNSPEHVNLATSDSEEVNSLVVPNPRRRRSMFRSPSGPAPQMSTNNPATGSFPTTNAFPGPYTPPSTNLDFTPSSSCASSSPKRWWNNPTM